MTSLIMIVTAGQQANANAAVAAVTGVSADNQTFTNGLSPTGQEPATHYWAAGPYDDGVAVQNALSALPGTTLESYDPDTQPGRPWGLLASLGLQVVVAGGI